MNNFPEEQLDSPAGYFPIHLGQTLASGRWKIIRKLGWGPRSSTWLALDNERVCYDAIKIFTVAATEDSTGKNERDFLLGPIKNLADSEESHVPEILSHFYEQDAKGKRHLCLVLCALGSSVEDLRLSNTYDGEYLALHVVQKVIGDISKTLANLAKQKIVHNAVTADNFLFWTIQADLDIQKELARFPTKKAEKIQGSDGVTYASAKSQPFAHGFTWDCSEEDIMCAQIYLSNYAYARQMAATVTSGVPKTFLPPEAFQNKKTDTRSDIWMLGCTAYLLLTGTRLFSESYIASPIQTATETLGKLETLLIESGQISEKDIPATLSFLKSCLAIKPANRATAEELLHGNWVMHYVCSCGWRGDD